MEIHFSSKFPFPLKTFPTFWIQVPLAVPTKFVSFPSIYLLSAIALARLCRFNSYYINFKRIGGISCGHVLDDTYL